MSDEPRGPAPLPVPAGPMPSAPRLYETAPSPERRTEPLAVASMVTSLVGLPLGGVTAPVGLGLGIAALVRMRRNGRVGHGLAIAGIVIGSVGTAFLAYVVAVVLFIGASLLGYTGFGDPVRDVEATASASGPPPEALPYYSLRTDLRVGDCLGTYPDDPGLYDVSVVECSVSHWGEVLALSTFSAPVTSHDPALAGPAWYAAWNECVLTAGRLLPAGYDTFGELRLFAPHPDAFDSAGGSTGYCTFLAWADPLRGSAVSGTL